MNEKNCSTCKHAVIADGDYFCSQQTYTLKQPGREVQKMAKTNAAHWCPKWRPVPERIKGSKMTRYDTEGRRP